MFSDILSKVKLVKAAYDKFMAGEYASFVDTVGDLFKAASELLKSHTNLTATAGDDALSAAEAELLALHQAVAVNVPVSAAVDGQDKAAMSPAAIVAIIQAVMQIISFFKKRQSV